MSKEFEKWWKKEGTVKFDSPEKKLIAKAWACEAFEDQQRKIEKMGEELTHYYAENGMEDEIWWED